MNVAHAQLPALISKKSGCLEYMHIRPHKHGKNLYISRNSNLSSTNNEAKLLGYSLHPLTHAGAEYDENLTTMVISRRSPIQCPRRFNTSPSS